MRSGKLVSAVLLVLGLVVIAGGARAAACSVPYYPAVVNGDRLAFTVMENPGASLIGWATTVRYELFRTPCAGDPSRSAVVLKLSGMVPALGAKFQVCYLDVQMRVAGGAWKAARLRQSYGTNDRFCQQVTLAGESYVVTFEDAALDGAEQGAIELKIEPPLYRMTAGDLNLFAYRGDGGTAVAVVPHMGWWFNPAEAGRGWALGRNGERLYFGGFFYADDGAQAWAVANLARTDANQYQGDLIACSGGQALNNPSPQAPGCTAGLGTVVLQVLSPRSIRVQVPRGGQGPVVLDLVPFDSF